MTQLNYCCTLLFTAEEIEIEDCFPDYEEEDEEGSLMLTTRDAICALEVRTHFYKHIMATQY